MQEGTMRRPAGPEVVVGVGDCRFAQYPDGALATYALGSCLAIIAFDWKIRLGGLLHVMLPDSSIDRAAAGRNPFVYVDTGVPELIRRIEEKGGLKRRMRCSVVGGPPGRALVRVAVHDLGAEDRLVSLASVVVLEV